MIKLDNVLQSSSKEAERFICEWTCSESLEEMKKDIWSTSEVHSALTDFIISIGPKER